MRIEWAEEAANQFEKEIDYISKENPIAGNKVSANILRNIDLLQTMPQMGRPGKMQGTRELVIHDLPYFVRYRTNKEKIQILNIFHTSRKYL